MQEAIGLHLKVLTVSWLCILAILHSHYKTTILERLAHPLWQLCSLIFSIRIFKKILREDKTE